MKSSVLLTTLIGAGLASAADCPAPGLTDSQGRYSCNPAHEYPSGQTCKTIDGCLFLVEADGKPVIITTTTSAVLPTGTPVCPAPGSTDSQGRYSCNPAHQYPNGQTCKAIDGCLFLVDANGKPIISITTPTSSGVAQPTGTPACPAPGSTDSQGHYSCNPAHQYPNGQTCKSINGCLILCDANGTPIISPTGSSPPGPAVTAGAATLGGAGMLALVAAAVALL
ncbi:hypothetical protein E4U55_007859 [Claviceps digitariae]|nr:hypothetical protein E4U55_007859 [Claviceps digitariae]